MSISEYFTHKLKDVVIAGEGLQNINLNTYGLWARGYLSGADPEIFQRGSGWLRRKILKEKCLLIHVSTRVHIKPGQICNSFSPFSRGLSSIFALFYYSLLFFLKFERDGGCNPHNPPSRSANVFIVSLLLCQWTSVYTISFEWPPRLVATFKYDKQGFSGPFLTRISYLFNFICFWIRKNFNILFTIQMLYQFQMIDSSKEKGDWYSLCGVVLIYKYTFLLINCNSSCGWLIAAGL